MPKLLSTVIMNKNSVLSIPSIHEKLVKMTEMNNLTINTVNTSLMISKSSQPRKIAPKTTQFLCTPSNPSQLISLPPNLSNTHSFRSSLLNSPNLAKPSVLSAPLSPANLVKVTEHNQSNKVLFQPGLSLSNSSQSRPSQPNPPNIIFLSSQQANMSLSPLNLPDSYNCSSKLSKSTTMTLPTEVDVQPTSESLVRVEELKNSTAKLFSFRSKSSKSSKTRPSQPNPSKITSASSHFSRSSNYRSKSPNSSQTSSKFVSLTELSVFSANPTSIVN